MKISIYYHNVLYRWDDLSQRIRQQHKKNTIIDSFIAKTSESFQTTINIITGFISSNTVFPINPNISVQDQQTLLQQYHSFTKQNVALVIATSGCQSQAKLVLLSRKNILSHCQSIGHTLILNRKMIWLNCLPLYHIASISILYRCLYFHATMVLHQHFDVKKIWHDFHHYQITHISLVPIMLERLLDYQLELKKTYQKSDLPDSISAVIIGGDKICKKLYQRAIHNSWPILISYGMTEACSTIALGNTPNKLKLLPGLVAKVDKEGIIYLKGEMIFLSYVKESSNKSVFYNGWFKTNDIGLLSGEYLSLSDRADNRIISAGHTISPQYVRQLLLPAPSIKDIVITKISHSSWGDTIVAFIVGDLDKFKIWVKKYIKSIYQPRIFIPLKKIPRNKLGKINYIKLQQLLPLEKQ